MRKLFLAAIPLLVGCGAPYRFVAHAEPNPFTRPGCRANFEPLRVDALMVGEKPVAQYAGEKSAGSADSFDNDLRAADGIFHGRVAEDYGFLFMPGGAPDNTFTIRPMFVHWEPGFYAVFAARPGVANVVFDVLAPNGQLLDKVEIETRASDFSSGGRMRLALKDAGRRMARYLGDNWLCAAH
ncbi:MAG TPA: hypothetical protein VGH87_24510 [Polyangiaceae bacterium]|jgi:hypothetical protein|nr:hypothetical protein [Polyangiaceae bacterium]